MVPTKGKAKPRRDSDIMRSRRYMRGVRQHELYCELLAADGKKTQDKLTKCVANLTSRILVYYYVWDLR